MAHLFLDGEPLLVFWIVCKVVNLLILAPAGKKAAASIDVCFKIKGKIRGYKYSRDQMKTGLPSLL